MASVFDLDLHRIKVEEYHRMVRAGVFDEDDRLELLDGMIVEMSPQSPEHARVIRWLVSQLSRALPPSLVVSPQLPLTIPPANEPEPDIAVIAADTPAGEHPKTAALVIEVALDSLRNDRLIKAALYAGARIPEYWIVNLAERCVEVHRDPDTPARLYRTTAVVRKGETLSGVAVPEIRIDVAQLFAE